MITVFCKQCGERKLKSETSISGVCYSCLRRNSIRMCNAHFFEIDAMGNCGYCGGRPGSR